ncbi:arylacetamide deacetylase-like 3 [Dasypus novemcinctus]|uniref:arylacetamide deacetylase-like 3 n=1 Tax=Dasypus novemcinctus TaxID=9361 RepID=UPI00265EB1A1|nr:arylacetamide deacetylase-like 3 [Dasypus novemcinctus]
MATLVLISLGAACVLAWGVGLWVVCKHFLTTEIPAAISHPVRLRVLDCLCLLAVTWGTILEKLGICSMPRFVQFIHDLPPVREDPDLVVTDLHFGTVLVRLYRPRAASSTRRPGILFFHGGGNIMGSLKMYHGICSRLSKESDSVVLAVRYRQGPDYRFPIPLRDCFVATVHFLKSLDTFKVDPARVVICGDSLGGGLATVICQKLLNRPDLPKIRAQILIYAASQALTFQHPSYQEYSKVPLLSRNFYFYCWCHYLGISPSWESVVMKGAHLPAKVWAKYGKWFSLENIPEKFKKRSHQLMAPTSLNEDAYLETSVILDVSNSPLIAEDDIISRLPETCIVTCENDLLRDHSLLYKKRLEDLKVPVTWCHMEDGFHGVLNTIDLGYLYFPCSRRIMNVIVNFVKGL